MTELTVKTEETKTQGRRSLVQRWSDYWIAGILIIMLLGFAVLAPGFISLQNWLSTSVYATQTLLLALGETFIIITAGIDLSVGAALGLSVVTGSLVMQALGSSPGLAIALGIVVSIATGSAVGLLNGLIITKMRITPFIVTLGMLGMASGVGFLLSGGNDITNIPPQLVNFGSSVWIQFLPVPVVVTAVLAVIFGIVLHKTRFGRYTYAVGSNPEATRVAGINISRHLTWVYTLAGFLAGVGGMLNVARFGVGSPIAGQNYELNAIAAVVIGGASLFGGVGTVFGTVIGALITSVLVTGLVILNVQPYWQTVAIGAIIIVAVYMDQLQKKNRT